MANRPLAEVYFHSSDPTLRMMRGILDQINRAQSWERISDDEIYDDEFTRVDLEKIGFLLTNLQSLEVLGDAKCLKYLRLFGSMISLATGHRCTFRYHNIRHHPERQVMTYHKACELLEDNEVTTLQMYCIYIWYVCLLFSPVSGFPTYFDIREEPQAPLDHAERILVQPSHIYPQAYNKIWVEGGEYIIEMNGQILTKYFRVIPDQYNSQYQDLHFTEHSDFQVATLFFLDSWIQIPIPYYLETDHLDDKIIQFPLVKEDRSGTCTCSLRSEHVQTMLDSLEDRLDWTDQLVKLLCPECQGKLLPVYQAVRKNMAHYRTFKEALEPREKITWEQFQQMYPPKKQGGSAGAQKHEPETWSVREDFDPKTHRPSVARLVRMRQVQDRQSERKAHMGLFDVNFKLAPGDQQYLNSCIQKLNEITTSNVTDITQTSKSICDTVIKFARDSFKEIAMFLGIAAIIVLAWSKGWPSVAMLGAIVAIGYAFRTDLQKLAMWCIEKYYDSGDDNKLFEMNLDVMDTPEYDQAFEQVLKQVMEDDTLTDRLHRKFDHFHAKRLAQIGEDNFTQIVMTLLFGAVAFLTVRMLPDDKDTQAFIKKVGVLPKATRGFADLIVQFQSVSKWVENFVRVNVLKQNPQLIDGGMSEINAWFTELEFLIREENFKKIPVDSDLAGRAIDVYSRAIQFEREKHSMCLDAQRKLVMGQRTAFQLYQAGMNSPKYTNRSRPRPVCLMLRGGTSLGKTAIVELIASAVLTRALGKRPEDIDKNGLANYLYSRNPQQDFWDGFQTKGHEIVLYDDFGQVRDVAGSPNPEWAEIIHGINGFCFNLHMAELAQKATTTLEAKMFILTSNMHKISCPSLIDPSAIVSRLTDPYRVAVDPEYLEEGPDGQSRLNVQKAREACGQILNLSIYRFYPQYINQAGHFLDSSADWITFDQLVDRMVEKVRSNGVDLAQMEEFRRNYIRQAQMHFNNPLSSYKACDYCKARMCDGYDWRVIRREDRLCQQCQQHRDAGDDEFFEPQVTYIESCRNSMVSIVNETKDKMAKVKEWFDQHPVIRKLALIMLCLGALAGVYKIASYAYKKAIRAMTPEMMIQVATPIRKTMDFDFLVESGMVTSLALASAYGQSVPKVAIRGENKQQAVEHIKKVMDKEDSPVICWTIPAKEGELEVTFEELNKILHEAVDESAGCFPTFPQIDYAAVQQERESQSAHNGRGRQRGARRRFQNEGMPAEQFWRVVNNAQEMTNLYDGSLKCFEVQVNGEKAVKYEVKDAQDLVIETEQNIYTLPRPKRVAHSQECEDLTVKVRRNMVVFGIEREGTSLDLGCWTFIQGTLVLMNHHFLVALKQLKPGTRLYYRSFGQSMKQYIPVEWVLQGQRIENKDAWLFDARLDAQKKDLTRLFIDQQDLDRIAGVRCRLVTREKHNFPEYPNTLAKEGRVKYMTETRPKAGVYHPQDESIVEELVLMSCLYSDDIITVPGQCGGVLILDQDEIRGKLCGLLAIGNGASYSEYTPLYREEILRAVEKFRKAHGGIVMAEPTIVVEDLTAQLPSEVKGKFYVEGRVPPLWQQPQTALRKTEINGLVFPDEVAPAVLRRTFDDNDPLFKGLKKCAEPRPPIDEKILEAATRNVERKLRAQVREPREKHLRVFSYEEAITGIEGEEFIDAINRKTSPGIPWQYHQPRGGKGKHHWLGKDEDFKFGTPENNQLKDVVESGIHLAKRGHRIEVLYTDTLKDELRPVVDGVVKKTRVFSAAPMHFVIMGRMYCLDFMAFVQKNRITNGIAVGINPFSSDWDLLAKRMKRFPNVIAGDFSDFDGSISQQVLGAAFDIINRYYSDSPDNQMVRKVICSMIAQSQHVLDGIVYQWDHSQTSGNPFTALVNSMVNLIVMEVAWLTETGLPLSEFDNHVQMIAYGDDNVLCLSDYGMTVFNQEVMARGLARIGMTYTDELKEGLTTTGRRLEDVEFLKRGFEHRQELERWVAPIRLTSVAKMLNWQHKSGNPDQVLADEISTALRELSLHPEHIYNQYRDKIYEVTPARVMEMVQTEPTWWTWQIYWRDPDSATMRFFHIGRIAQMMNNPEAEAENPAITLDEDLSEAQQSRLEQQPVDSTPISDTQTEQEDGGLVQTTLEGQEVTIFHASNNHPRFDYIQKAEYDKIFHEMLATATQDYTESEITHFLNTPVKVGTFVWDVNKKSLSSQKSVNPSGNDLAQSQLFNMIHPTGLIHQKGANRKLTNMTMFRANMKVRLFMNVQPFQCGSLYITSQPLPTQLQNRNVAMAWSTMTSWTSQPGVVVVTKAGNQAIDFKIRPIGPELYFDLTNDSPNALWGQLYVHCLTPLYDPAGTGQVEITMFAWFEDVDLKFRTGRPIKISALADVQHGPEKLAYFGRRAQIGEKDQQEKQGLLTGASKALSSVSHLMGQVPGLQQYAEPASSVASAIGGVAKEFGYSKPSSDAVTQRNQLFYHDMLTSDGNFLGHSLGAVQKNFLDPHKITGPSVDEMTIRNLINQPAILDTFQLDDSQTTNTIIYYLDVNPMQYWHAGSYDEDFVVSVPPMTAALWAAMYWSGEMKIQIEAVHTQFHSASLELIYVPRYFGDDLNGIDTDMCYRYIWNIKDARKTTFICPFVSSKQWLRISSAWEFARFPNQDKILYATGRFYIRVLNALTVTAAASPKIDFLVTMLPGKGFNWGGIQPIECEPYYPHDQMFYAERVAQMAIVGKANEDTGRTVTRHIDLTRGGAISHSNNATTIGEMFLSYRELVKMFEPLSLDLWRIDEDETASPADLLLISPNLPVRCTSNFPKLQNYSSASYINHINSMFALRRGGTRLIIAPLTGDTQDFSTTPFRVIPCNTIIETENESNLLPCQPMFESPVAEAGKFHGQLGREQIVPLNNEGMISIEVPMYSESHVLCNEWMSAKWPSLYDALPHKVNLSNFDNACVEHLYPENRVVLTPFFQYVKEDVPETVTYLAARDDYSSEVFAGCPLYKANKKPLFYSETDEPGLMSNSFRQKKLSPSLDKTVRALTAQVTKLCSVLDRTLGTRSIDPEPKAMRGDAELYKQAYLRKQAPNHGKPLLMVNRWPTDQPDSDQSPPYIDEGIID